MDQLFSNLAPQATSLTMPIWLDLTAVVVGGISGALTACERKFDLIGVVTLCLVCGLGGGLIRDVIMQVNNVYMLKSPYAIPVCLLTGLVVFFFRSPFTKVNNLIEWIDIIGVGLFCASGCDKAIVYYLTPVAAILMGILTGIGGGLLRDVLMREVPAVFQRGNLYAMCAMFGAMSYCGAIVVVGLSKPVAAAICVFVTVALRRISLRFNILSPTAVDLTPKVAKVAKIRHTSSAKTKPTDKTHTN